MNGWRLRNNRRESRQISSTYIYLYGYKNVLYCSLRRWLCKMVLKSVCSTKPLLLASLSEGVTTIIIYPTPRACACPSIIRFQIITRSWNSEFTCPGNLIEQQTKSNCSACRIFFFFRLLNMYFIVPRRSRLQLTSMYYDATIINITKFGKLTVKRY